MRDWLGIGRCGIDQVNQEVTFIMQTRIRHILLLLYEEMMAYFKEVGARIPIINPDYDAEVYQQAKEYDKRMKWGPFEGKRPLDEDEK